VWGQWIYGNQISDKFDLKYGGKASLFESQTTPPTGFNEVKLQIVAEDQAGNFGQQILSFKK
jgi:hypothetical protein